MKYILFDNSPIDSQKDKTIRTDEVKLFKPQNKDAEKPSLSKNDQGSCKIKQVVYIVLPFENNVFSEYINKEFSQDLARYLQSHNSGELKPFHIEYTMLKISDYSKIVPNWFQNELGIMNEEFLLIRVYIYAEIDQCGQENLIKVNAGIPDLLMQGFSSYLEANYLEGLIITSTMFDHAQAETLLDGETKISSFVNQFESVDVSLEFDPKGFGNDIEQLKSKVQEVLGVDPEAYIEQQGRMQNFVVEPLHPREANELIEKLGNVVQVVNMENNEAHNVDHFQELFRSFFDDEIFIVNTKTDKISEKEDSDNPEDYAVFKDENEVFD